MFRCERLSTTQCKVLHIPGAALPGHEGRRKQMPRKDYHKPGYVRPSQRNTGMLAAHLSYDILDSFKDVAAEQNMTIQRAVAQAAQDFIAKHKKPPSLDC
jgi:hypothetical protein